MNLSISLLNLLKIKLDLLLGIKYFERICLFLIVIGFRLGICKYHINDYMYLFMMCVSHSKCS